MLERLGSALTRWTQRYMPDPFVLAILLTFVTFGGALVYTGFDVRGVLVAWVDGPGGGKGFWNLLAFGMQMCLILVTGHALAASPPMRRALDRLAALAKTPESAVVIVAGGAMGFALLNWGLGLIAGALLAREVGQRARARGVAVHYPLLAAAGYTGMLVWHGGLSGSAPLKVTLSKDLNEILGPELAASVAPMPLGATIGSPANIAASLVLLALLPLVLVRMLPKHADERVAAPEMAGDVMPPVTLASGAPPAARLDGSKIPIYLLTIGGIAAWGIVVARQGIGHLDPNLINFLFLFLGLLFHGSAVSYAAAVTDAARGCAGVILQFPFYAGIMGMLTGTGLLTELAAVMASVGGAALPAVAFYSAGLVNLFVPSGGGQWAVQGPILIEAAVKTGVEPAKVVMALAYGDQWTNMLQPFWALPLLAITRVEARDVIGYTAVLLLVSQVVFLGALYLG